MAKTVTVDTLRRGNARLRNPDYNTRQYNYLVVAPSRSGAVTVALVIFIVFWMVLNAIISYYDMFWVMWTAHKAVMVDWRQLIGSAIAPAGVAMFFYIITYNNNVTKNTHLYREWLEESDIVEETTTETVEDEDTAILNYSESPAMNAEVRVNGEPMQRHEDSRTIGAYHFTGRMMHVLKLRAARGDFIVNRDTVWNELKDEIDGSVSNHYGFIKNEAVKRGGVRKEVGARSGQRRGGERFCQSTPPTPKRIRPLKPNLNEKTATTANRRA